MEILSLASDPATVASSSVRIRVAMQQWRRDGAHANPHGISRSWWQATHVDFDKLLCILSVIGWDASACTGYAE